jgi:hypothetical protein
MNTESDQSSGNSYQSSSPPEAAPPEGAFSWGEPAGLVPPWSVPPGLIVPVPRPPQAPAPQAPAPQAPAPQVETPAAPAAQHQRPDPGNQPLAGPELEAEDAAWPGVARPAEWFLRPPQPPLPAASSEGANAPSAAAESPETGTPARALAPTEALRGRAGGPGFQPSRTAEGTWEAADLTPWQKSAHQWSQAGIRWEQSPQTHVSGRPISPGAHPPEPARSAWPGHTQLPLGAPVFAAPTAEDDVASQAAVQHPRPEPEAWTEPDQDTWTEPDQDTWTEPDQDTWTEQDAWDDPRDRWAEQRRPVRGRSSLPPPSEASWSSPDDTFLLESSRPGARRPATQRGLVSRRTATVGVPVIVLVAVAALALALLTGHGPKSGVLAANQGNEPGQSQNVGTPQLPLTEVALATYPGQQQRDVFQTINRVVASGNTVVATGSQATAGVVRQQFFTSSNGGVSWQLAPVRGPGGGQPPLGHPATLLAGGPGGWLAVGPQAIWTSQNGLSWTLAATHGISPQLPGDAVWVITRTATGFLAAGEGAAGRGATQAVIWTSADGVTWHRMTAAQLGLAAAGQTVENISYATWRGDDTVISGTVAAGGKTFGVAWLSTDSGSAWTPVSVPADHGASSLISGLAFDGSGLIAVRPGRSASGADDGVSYFSPNGRTWQYSGTIDPAGGWSPAVVKGSDNGFVVTGQTADGQIVAYTSTGTGAAWLPTGSLGSASTESVAGATVVPGNTIIAIGSTIASRVSQQPVFLEANAAGSVHPVSLAGLAGGTVPEVAVNSTAVAVGQQIAVGSADGYPAVWRKASGGNWTLVSSLSLFAADPGLTALTSVTHGAAGWLAVGAPGPVILTSANGTDWRIAAGGITQGLAGVGAVAAASGPAGYVIVGKLVAPGGACVADVWWSPNLTSWTRARDVNDATGSSQVLAVAAGAHGFVSVGSHEAKPAVWTTANGRSWETIVLPVPDGATAATLEQVAITGNRVIALGQVTTAAGPVPFAELSVDGGANWRQVPFSSPGPDTAFTALTADSAGFTAAGLFGEPGQQNVAVWTSATGTSWTPTQASDLSGAGAWQIDALAPSGSAVAGIGSITTQQSQQTVTLTLPARSGRSGGSAR